jgi:hypothetical protein
MPNEWDTFVQEHTTLKVVVLSNKIKELNVKNKFRHKLGPGGYKDAMPKWAKKEQELRVAGFQISLKVAWWAPETESRVILVQMTADD